MRSLPLSLRGRVAAERGFTLIEVVLSIVLFAILMGILYGSFYLSERAATKAQARADVSQSLRTFEEVLGGYIRSAYPYRLNHAIRRFIPPATTAPSSSFLRCRPASAVVVCRGSSSPPSSMETAARRSCWKRKCRFASAKKPWAAADIATISCWRKD